MCINETRSRGRHILRGIAWNRETTADEPPSSFCAVLNSIIGISNLSTPPDRVAEPQLTFVHRLLFSFISYGWFFGSASTPKRPKTCPTMEMLWRFSAECISPLLNWCAKSWFWLLAQPVAISFAVISSQTPTDAHQQLRAHTTSIIGGALITVFPPHPQ